MKWLSVDPANKSGLAYWEDARLVSTTVLRKMGATGKHITGGGVFSDRWGAWMYAIDRNETVICEEGFGRFPAAIAAQGEQRGFIRAACMYKEIPFVVVNTKEWGRVIKETFSISWPAQTERKKALAVQLVQKQYGITVTDDEADAVLIGVAAMRMGLVNVGINQEARNDR
jgi:hypothetical protein